mgnify:CR=1 FL=1
MPDDEKVAVGTWLRLLKCYNLIYKELRERLFDTDLTLPQLDMLIQLGRVQDGLPVVELSRRMLVTAGNVTGIVDRLEEKGLVIRVRQREDRRVTKVKLTDEGWKLLKEMIPRHEEDIDEIFSVLSREELLELRALLDKLRVALEKRED